MTIRTTTSPFQRARKWARPRRSQHDLPTQKGPVNGLLRTAGEQGNTIQGQSVTQWSQLQDIFRRDFCSIRRQSSLQSQDRALPSAPDMVKRMPDWTGIRLVEKAARTSPSTDAYKDPHVFMHDCSHISCYQPCEISRNVGICYFPRTHDTHGFDIDAH